MRNKYVIYALLILLMLSLMCQYLLIRSENSSILITGKFDNNSAIQLKSYLDSDPLVESYSSYSRTGTTLMYDSDMRRSCEVEGIYVNGEYTPPYLYKIHYGRFLSPEDSAKIVISTKQASTLFCRYDCIGQQVSLNGELFEVVGVYEKIGVVSQCALMGAPEAYIANPATHNNWLVTVTSGKEMQRLFSLTERLYFIGVQSSHVVALFQYRAGIRFIVELQICISIHLLLLNQIRRFKQKQISSRLRNLVQIIVYSIISVSYLMIIMRFPLDPQVLPTSFTPDAIWQKMKETVIQWNNSAFFPSMETSYLKWQIITICINSLLLWGFVSLLRRNRRKPHAK